MAETIVSLLALSPFIVAIPMLGKQLDIKHKTFDTARYALWERTVWRSDGTSNRKSEDDIVLEARDRTLGNPLAGLTAVEQLRDEGVTENTLWRDLQRRRLLDHNDEGAPIEHQSSDQPAPVDVGVLFVPAIAYGDGLLGELQRLLRLDSLSLNRRAYAGTSVAIGIRPVLRELAGRPMTLGERIHVQARDRSQVVHTARGAILSDTWTARDERQLRHRVDEVTVNELVEQFELPGRPIALQALGKGRPLYGEGQFGWEPDLRPRSSDLPAAYVEQR
ncbi:hypothetical protein HNQ60_001909 [Povalibacter uvarum]|uniref:Uncharacterized protein n=2 Tax=Povalibacter uvarum TaxID=732238 RepID=A0A841HIL9_9GAMM|nr:hypothetical protein [Povalibacter uvarum]